MNWNKLGQIYQVDNVHAHLTTHASNPLPIHLEGDIYRVFYSGRNVDNKSSVGWVELNILNGEIINQCTQPAVSFGKDNSFYSHGISIGNAYQDFDGNTSVLFMGWQIRGNNHWRGDVGKLHINSRQVNLAAQIPFMKTDNEDKVSLSYPCVIHHDGSYKMWYGSTDSWTSENGEMIHVIKYATSTDGKNWAKHGVAIPFEIGVAQAFSKPSVIVDAKGFHMWYSYRNGTGTTYRIGYSHSKDGIKWTNKLDEVGITVSETGWDSEMVCYPAVFDHHGKRYMMYNGNSYGKQGFGLAVLEA